MYLLDRHDNSINVFFRVMLELSLAERAAQQKLLAFVLDSDVRLVAIHMLAANGVFVVALLFFVAEIGLFII